MKMRILIVVTLLTLFATGCAEEFVGGFAAGAAGMKVMADDAQEKFIEAVNELNAETERLNAEIGVVKDIDIEAFVKPETIAAIDSLKEKGKDPILWIALASLLMGGTGVNLYKNRKTK